MRIPACIAAVSLVMAVIAARPADARHATHRAVEPPPAPAAPWGVLFRRACRAYTPPGDLVFDHRGNTLAWCLGRFALGDGRYLGPVSYNLDAPRVILDDGREIVPRESTPGRWDVAVRHAHGRSFDPVAAALTGFRTVTLSVRGESALVTRADGRRAVVAIPSGRTVLPLAANGEESRSAVSPNGTVLALAGPGSLVIYDISGTAPRTLAVLHEHHAAMAFGPDGRTLFTTRGDGTLLTAWREGAPDVSPPAQPVSFAVGAEVTPVEHPDGWRPRLDASRRPPLAPRGEHGLVTAWRRLYGAHDEVADARVYATDAREFAASNGRTTGWARAVMERYADGGYDAGRLRVWRTHGTHGERAAEWRTRGRTRGWLTTVRAQEVGGTLYRVEIDRQEGARADDTQALMDDLINDPFGRAPTEHGHPQ